MTDSFCCVCLERKHSVDMHFHDLEDKCRNDQQKRQDGSDCKEN